MIPLINAALCLLLSIQTAFIEYINLIPDSRVAIDYGTTAKNKPVVLVLYALPNGNTIEWTAGKKLEAEDDWHFDIQHIKAQTEFIRDTDTTKRYIVAYLQSSIKAWTGHSAKYNGDGGIGSSFVLYPKLVDTLEQIVHNYLGQSVDELALTSHSGGGRFIFNYISGVKAIPQKVTRFSFIDSNYGFEDSLHTTKLVTWLKNSPKHKLAVFSYVDTTVIFNGKHIVSSKGGTGYKTEEMFKAIRETLLSKNWKFYRTCDTCFVKMYSANSQLLMLKKENPQGKIYHTVLVEKNGFIHSLLFSTPFENKGYTFWGSRSYLPNPAACIFKSDELNIVPLL